MNESDTHEQKFTHLKVSRYIGYHIVPLKSLDISDPPNLSISASCLATPKSALEAMFRLLLRCFDASKLQAKLKERSSKRPRCEVHN